MDVNHLLELTIPFLERNKCEVATGPDLIKIVELLRERVNTVEELADAAVYFFRPLIPSDELKAQHFSPEIKPVLDDLVERFATIQWDHETINAEIKSTAKAHQTKMPKLAMPLRVMVTGESQTPSIAAVLALLGREESLTRMNHQLSNFSG